MPLLQVKDYVNDVYVLLGNVTRDQVPLELVLKLLYNELDKRRIQMGLSENNQFLKVAEKNILDQRDQLVSVADINMAADVVAVHLANPENFWERPLEIVNFNTLPGWETDGQLKVALYGQPLRIRFSLDMTPNLSWNLKFWYEPDVVTRGINSNVVIPTIFKSLVTLSVALHALPDAEIPPEKKAEKMSSFVAQLGNQDIDGSLENAWYKHISFQGNYGGNFRRPFRAGQLHHTHHRR